MLYKNYKKDTPKKVLVTIKAPILGVLGLRGLGLGGLMLLSLAKQRRPKLPQNNSTLNTKGLGFQG